MHDRQQTIADDNGNPATILETTDKISYGILNPDRVAMVRNFSNKFGTSSKNIGHEKSKWNPQVQSGDLDIFPKGQGVGLHIF